MEENQEEENYDKDETIQALMQQLKESNSKNVELSSSLGVSSSTQQLGSNLVQYQLETVTIIDNLRNFYSGKQEAYDNEGNIVFVDPKNTDLIPLNELGVNSMMEIVSKYIDKNTTLSYYNEERIFEILADLGDELTLVLFCNYEKWGMNTHHKKTKFRVLILTTLHIIESTYRRSLRGQTSNDLNQSRIVTQSDNIGARFNQQIPINTGFKIPNPFKKGY